MNDFGKDLLLQIWERFNFTEFENFDQQIFKTKVGLEKFCLRYLK